MNCLVSFCGIINTSSMTDGTTLTTFSLLYPFFTPVAGFTELVQPFPLASFVLRHQQGTSTLDRMFSLAHLSQHVFIRFDLYYRGRRRGHIFLEQIQDCMHSHVVFILVVCSVWLALARTEETVNDVKYDSYFPRLAMKLLIFLFLLRHRFPFNNVSSSTSHDSQCRCFSSSS